MREPPFDRTMALASLVRTLKDHYLAVRCVCGAKRVIAIARMADHKRVADYTIAHVAMSLKCEGCFNGPDEVHLTATCHGLDAPAGAVDLVWTMPLIVRHGDGARRRRNPLY